MESKLIYDALSMTSRIDSPETIMELLGIRNATWEIVKGAHGYKDRYYWNSISIHFNGREDMGVWLEMMGQGCRAFETYGSGCYEDLFAHVLTNPGQVNLTRLDVAFDDLDGLLDMAELVDDTRAGRFVSRFSDWQCILGSKGDSVTHGSQKSEIFIRIYDKAMERGYTDGRHWIRTELQLRRDRALAFINQMGTVGDRFGGVLLNYLRYIEDTGMDSNRWRWPMRAYWERLTGEAQKISLYTKPGTDYNKANLEHYVYEMSQGAAYTLLQLDGPDEYLRRMQVRPPNLNPKYQRLIDLYKK